MAGRLVHRLMAAGVGTVVCLAATATPATADATVDCNYRFSEWSGGFVADIDIINHGPQIDGWTVRWTFDTPTRLLGVWSAMITQETDTSMSATPTSWTAVVPSGQMRTFGWSALAASTDVPAEITINGVAC